MLAKCLDAADGYLGKTIKKPERVREEPYSESRRHYEISGWGSKTNSLSVAAIHFRVLSKANCCGDGRDRWLMLHHPL